MNVTRNVIDDLLPVYLAGEASGDRGYGTGHGIGGGGERYVEDVG